MAATAFTLDKFNENLKSGRYETATASRRAVGKALWTNAKKDEARASIDKHFATSSAKAAPKTKGKPGPKPKAAKPVVETKVKGKPGPKPGSKRTAKVETKKASVAPPAPKKRGRPVGSGKKVASVPTGARAVLRELETVASFEGGLSEYELKLIELAIEEQNALSGVLAAAPAAKALFTTLNVEEIQTNVDLYAQLTRRIESILGPALDHVITQSVGSPVKAEPRPATKGRKKEPAVVIEAAAEEEAEEAEDDGSENGVSKDEEERRSRLWSGALPIAEVLGLRSLLVPQEVE